MQKNKILYAPYYSHEYGSPSSPGRVGRVFPSCSVSATIMTHGRTMVCPARCTLPTNHPTRPGMALPWIVDEREIPPSMFKQEAHPTKKKKQCTMSPWHPKPQRVVGGIPSPSSTSDLRLSPAINSSPNGFVAHSPRPPLSLQLQEEDNPHLYLRPPHAAEHHPPLN